MDGVITGEYTFKELTFSSPKKTTVTTDESKFSFLGSTDPHFPVTMNGEALKLTEKGGFAVDVTLKPGKNTFTFVSNGKTVTFTVTYTLTILKSVSPGQAMTMAGRQYGGLQRHCPQGLQGHGGLQRQDLYDEGLAAKGGGGRGRSGAFRF